jgi:hypothetical protein
MAALLHRMPISNPRSHVPPILSKPPKGSKPEEQNVKNFKGREKEGLRKVETRYEFRGRNKGK